MTDQNEWLILEVFRNVVGPYTSEEVRRRSQREPNFFVYDQSTQEWTPVDSVPGLMGRPSEESPDGDPPKAFTVRELEQAVDELLGVCKGIISDGQVVPEEADYLKLWLEKHAAYKDFWPANVLSERIAKIYKDGVVDESEQEELAELLGRITGEKPGFKDAIELAKNVSADFPQPRVDFEGKSFCLTGRFAYGPHAKCVAAIEAHGGSWTDFPNLETDYLVIGTLQGKHWDLPTKGKKIEFVVTNPEARSRTAIISEENWAYHL
jgi:hypothetical protein